MSYSDIRNDYIADEPVSASDLNLRGDILRSQLVSAVDALGIGVIHAGDFLAGTDSVAAGGAVIRSDDGTPVIVRSGASLPIPARGDFEYLHLVLRKPEIDDSAGTNSVRGAAPVLRVSEDEEEPDAILLAMWDGTQWVDKRPLSKLAQIESLLADVGYDADARAIGTINERLAALEGDGDDDAAGGLLAQFNAFKNAQLATNADFAARLVALEKLLGVEVTGNTRDLDRYAIRNDMRQDVAIAQLKPDFSLIADGSIFVPGTAGDGEQFGNGVTARDVHSGNTVIDAEKGEER